MNESIKVHISKDCRGIGCPMNLVHAKVGLSKLNSGEIMELILDDGAPVNNVPGSVEKEGHEVITRQQLEDGTWKLLIRKK